MAAGQARVEPQLVSEHGLILADLLATHLGDFVRNRLEDGIGAFAKIVSARGAGDQ